MKSLVIVLFITFTTSLISGCATPVMEKVDIACKVIYGITSLIGFRDSSNTDANCDDCPLKEGGCYEDITQ
jgi:uncharacterized membrane protein